MKLATVLELGVSGVGTRAGTLEVHFSWSTPPKLFSLIVGACPKSVTFHSLGKKSILVSDGFVDSKHRLTRKGLGTE